MFRRVGFVLVVLGALAVVQVASAAFPAPFAAQGGEGVTTNDGALRFDYTGNCGYAATFDYSG